MINKAPKSRRNTAADKVRNSNNFIDSDRESYDNVIIFLSIIVVCSIYLRHSALINGFVYYDDLVHAPFYLLRAYRFVQAFELFLMMQLFGDEYIISTYPKIVAIVYLILNSILVARVSYRWQSPAYLSALLISFYAFHPILSDFVLWNTLTPAHLGVSFSIIAFLVLVSKHKYKFLFVSFLLFLSAGTYPPCLGIFLTLLFFEALILRMAGLDERDVLIKGVFCFLFSGLLFFLYKTIQDNIMAEAFEVATRERRMVSFADLFLPEFWRRKYMEIANQYVNTILPLISVFTDSFISGKITVQAIATLFSIPCICIIIAYNKLTTKCIAILYFMIGISSPMFYNLTVNYSSLGIRVSISQLLAIVFSLAVARRLAQNTGYQKYVAVAVGVAGVTLTALTVPVTLLDARIRTEGWRATNDALMELAGLEEKNAVLPLPNPDRAAENSYREKSYLISYQTQSCREYGAARYFHVLTNERSRVPTEFLELDRFAEAEISLLQARCGEVAEQQVCGLAVASVPERGVNALCVYLPP